MNIYPGNDITGDGQAHKLSDNISGGYTRARLIHLVTTTLSGHAAIGDSTVSANNGGHLPLNVPVIYPPDGSDPTARYDLTQIYVFVPAGSTLTWSIAF